ncbi:MULTISPECIES: M48 family metallopeptidase [unclassified Thioalkalivibrio]|uniref:tetratricopeptide repeat protein n=1 Tax=unclassified Thioalkalivibrio TaxID=2621013 RepID=UPI00037BCE6F|nr:MULTISPECIES: hypothetical protein [unclassified Thioalkalivibrio]
MLISVSKAHQLAPTVALATALLAVGSLYALALPGYWLFDDWPNLVGLDHVDDYHSALRYILSGEAGPLGRPVSLLTFALQADAWAENPETMLRVNFAIHLLAMVAVFFLASGLTKLRPTLSVERAFWIGALTAAIWGIAPFLATTHLMVIQRMTSLSGLFVFAGLALFVWAHVLNNRTGRFLSLIGGLGVATALAALSKENGALLPLLALLILLAWIPRERWLRGLWERSVIVCLAVIPSLFILGYLGLDLFDTLRAGDYGNRREFTVAERLMSQPVILLDYLRQLLIPRAIAATPFMDHIPASRGLLDPPITLVAMAFWLALAGAAIWLRQIAPWFLFGLTFFLLAHVLESTFIGLELYFAHRNYVPAFGLFFALVYLVFTLPAQYLRAGLIALIAYALLSAIVLFQVTANWNDKRVNAEMWIDYNPHSVRGTQLLVQQLNASGEHMAARELLERIAKKRPEIALLQIQRTNNCIGAVEEFPNILNEVLTKLASTPRYRPIGPIELHRLSQSKEPSPLCPPRDHAVLIKLSNALLDNPAFSDRDFSKSQLLIARAFAQVHLGEKAKAVEDFHESVRLHPDLEIAFRSLSLQANLGDYEGAFAFLEELEANVPNDPLRHVAWRSRISEFRGILETSREIDRQSDAPGVFAPIPE